MPGGLAGGGIERGGVEVGENHFHAEAGEFHGGGKTDAAGGAGNDGDAIFGQGGVKRHLTSLSLGVTEHDDFEDAAISCSISSFQINRGGCAIECGHSRPRVKPALTAFAVAGCGFVILEGFPVSLALRILMKAGCALTIQIFDYQPPGVENIVEPLGHVLSVRGSEAQVGLPGSSSDHESRATVGKFLTIGAGDHRLIGMITEVSVNNIDHANGPRYGAIARIDLMGEIRRDAAGADFFQRGVSGYPAIGDHAGPIGKDELRLIYKTSSANAINIGNLHHDELIPAFIDVDNLLTKHFAVLGSTGVGKSSGVAVILGEILKARPDLRIFLLDGHNEFGRCFGERAKVIHPGNLKLPFWLFNFEEIVDVIYNGRPGIEAEIEILAELIPIAKGMYPQHKASADRLILRKNDGKNAGYTVDTPVPYLLQDLISLIDERMGKLENRSSRMNFHRLITRIETIRNDPRYAFMFENANVGGDTMADILTQLFRLEPQGKPMTVMQLAGLPVEVVDAFVCTLCRLAFDFGLWSDGAMPLLFVCEEAHRFASADHTIGFGPTRRALLRIAKEGRKYGVFLGLVTQRPAELDPTIISQCSTLFAMRMANDRDQALLRSAVSDAAANLLAFVPSLGTREVVGFGEGVPLPARLTFKALPAHLLPRSEAVGRRAPDIEASSDRDFIRTVVERWRGAALGHKPRMEEAPVDQDAGLLKSPGGSAAELRFEHIRSQILKR
jgi:DNA helicase HerA-like ATPase